MQTTRKVREFPDYFLTELVEMQNYVYGTLFLPTEKTDEKTDRSLATPYHPKVANFE